MKQGGKHKAAGFTIVETMIVLAVTGVMFLSVVLLISGKQNNTEFQQAINAVVTQLQQTTREVSIGYYPDVNNIKCTANGKLNFVNGTTTQQGTSQGCVFLGKVIQFGLGQASANEQYATFVLAGCQHISCSGAAEATTLSEASPMVIDRGTSSSTSNFPVATTLRVLENGLQTKYVKYYDASGNAFNTRAFGLLQSLGSYTSSCTGLCSGSQQAGLYGINDPGPYPQTQTQMVDLIDQSSNIVPASKVTICLQSGTTNQSGLITIGGNTTAVTLEIKNGGNC